MQVGKQIKYDVNLIENWQRDLQFTDEQLKEIMKVQDLPTFMNGAAPAELYDPATDRLRKVVFQKKLPGLDMRSAYLLNGINFEIRDLKLSPVEVQKITGVSAATYSDFLAGKSDRLVYEDAFDRMGVYYYQQVGNRLD